MSRRITSVLFCALLAASFLITSPTPAAEVTELAFLPGTIWDVDAERILWLDEQRRVWITDRRTNADALIYATPPSARDLGNGLLAPDGALFTLRDDNQFGDFQFRLFQSQANLVTNHGIIVNSSLAQAGDLLLFNRFYSGPDVERPGQPLVLRNLRTGDETAITWEAGNNGNDVTEDGVVSYWTNEGWSGPGDSTSDYNIFRWEDGEATRITDDTFLWNVYPRTDGAHIVYMKRPSLGFGGETELTLFAPGLGEVRLNRPSSGVSEGSYLINEGWIAYVESLGGRRLNLRSPAGDSTTLFNSSGFISLKGLTASGQVMFQADDEMYLAGIGPRAGGAAFLDLVDPSIFDNPVTYEARFVDDHWLLFGGGRVFAVQSSYNVPAPASGLLLLIGALSAVALRLRCGATRAFLVGRSLVCASVGALSIGIASAHAAEVAWVGGADSSWQTSENWSPVIEGEPPIPVQRIPGAGDSVVVSDPTHGTLVELNSETPELSDLLVSDGIQLKNNDFLLHVRDADAGVTTIRGDGTQLVLRDPLSSVRTSELATNRLRIEDGGSVLLDDALAAVYTHLQLGSGGSIGGVGKIHLGQVLPSSGPTVLDNNGTIFLEIVQTSAPELTIQAFNNGVLDLDGTSESGALVVDDGRPENAAMMILSPLADAFGGSIRIGNQDHLWLSHDATFTNAQVQFAPDAASGVAYLHAAREHARPRRLTVDGADTLFSISSDGQGLIDGQVEFQQGRFDVNGTLTLAGDFTFGRDFHLDLNDARQLLIQDFVTDGGTGGAATTINQRVIDLDGDGETTEIFISHPLTLNVDALDDDGTNTFNGKMTVDSYLTVNVPGGWEVDGEFIANDRRLTGSPVTFDEATVRFNAGGFGFSLFEMDAVFTENARVLIEGGVDFFRSNVVIQGGQWTAVGDRRARFVEFSGNVTITGPTTMRLRSVDMGSVGVGQGQLTIDQPLVIETDEVETGDFPVQYGETIEIGPDGQLRMVVGDSDFVPWTINRSLVLHGHEDGTFSEHLSGSDVVTVGGVSVSGASAWAPRVEFKSGVLLEQGASLRLDGGGTRLGTTNRILDTEILGAGTLVASAGNGLAGSGRIETPLAFDSTNSILAAEGGTLTVTGPIESIHTLAAADGTLALEGPWLAGEVGNVMLAGGTIRARLLPLAGSLSVSGHSTLDADDLSFAASSVTNLSGALTIRGDATIEPGAQFTGTSPLTQAESSRLTVADGGQIGTVLVNRGTLSLGHEGAKVAAVSLAGFRQNTTGALEIELAGPDEFDRLVSMASPHLDGTLRVSLSNGFEPDPGERFTIIESGSSILGQFAAVDLPQLRSGLDWSLEYLQDRVTLRTIGKLEMLPGDYDGSGSVNQRDLDFVLLSWGNPAEQIPPEWTSNLPSGLIDQEELDAVLLNWGRTADRPSEATGIPEPASFSTACILLVALLTATTGRQDRSHGSKH